MEEQVRLDVPVLGFEDLRRRVEPCELFLDRARGGEVGLRDDERVGDSRLLDRLRQAQPVHGVDGGDDRLQLVVMPHDGLGEERVDDRCRIGEPGRLDDDAFERREFRPARAG